ncbi:methyl-accepting chemotaxis protein [Candidatus Uabimicrobium amorphum]|uniref:Chemotaxis protein n=1 Tax=Uabimicrobium amorphum TaxID=2596890 RepID=A0A5S9IIE9_UABAM|nr:methyl-accepting chemotaxis protein [Candidatus Uabimicrobium amorphum]BBM82244.1 chemotaxis protein [Candidatus Uabimicrobium amorphum]
MRWELFQHRLGVKIFVVFFTFLLILTTMSIVIFTMSLESIHNDHHQTKIGELCQSIASQIPSECLSGKTSFSTLEENWQTFLSPILGEEYGIDLLTKDNSDTWKSLGGWGNLSVTNLPPKVASSIKRDDSNIVTVQKKSLVVTSLSLQDALLVVVVDKPVTSTDKSFAFIVFLVVCSLAVGIIFVYLLSVVVFSGVLPKITKIKDDILHEISFTKKVLIENETLTQNLKQHIQERKMSIQSSVNDTLRVNEHFSGDLHGMLQQLQMIYVALDKQNEKVKTMTDSLTDISSAIKDVSSNANKTVGTSRNSETDAKKGGEVVQQLILHMNKITKTVSNSAQVMKELAKRSHEIGDIINVIDDIADQTELLALNAAIQAARAGEQGRGFAVVADQIRTLAEKTTHATKEIAETLSAIQEESTSAVKAMDNSKKEIDQGTAFAVRAGVNLQKIVAGAKRVTRMISGIASSAETQSEATISISDLASDISERYMETHGELQTALSNSKELETCMTNLTALVEKFLVICSDTKLENEMVSFSEISLKQLEDRNHLLQKVQQLD